MPRPNRAASAASQFSAAQKRRGPYSPAANTGSVPSPALDLRRKLMDTLSGDPAAAEIAIARLPFKWTVLGLTLFCGSFWYLLARLIF